MEKSRPKWTNFCADDANPHEVYADKKACPSCGALNPSYKASKQSDIIEISDDSPRSSQALFQDKKSGRVSSTSRFQTYDQKPIGETVRQSSMQNARNTNASRAQSKITEEPLRTNVTLWLRRYRVDLDDELSDEIQTEFRVLERTIVPLKNAIIEDLDDFIHNHLLKEIHRWEKIVRKPGDRIHLATNATVKEGPTMLPISANAIRTVKGILAGYFQTKDRVIHIILNREDPYAYEDEITVGKQESSAKQESAVKKKGKHIKEETKAGKQKSKRPPSDSFETSISMRNKDNEESLEFLTSLVRTPSPLKEEYPGADTLHSEIRLSQVDGVRTENEEEKREQGEEEEEEADDLTSPTIRTRNQVALAEAAARKKETKRK